VSIATTQAPASDARLVASLARVPTHRLVPGANARGDELGDVDGLAASLKTLGQQVPLLVCQLADGRYEILDGHRRHAAAQLLGLSHLDVVLRHPPDPVQRTLRQLAMHSHARAFDPIAEARAIHQLMWRHEMSREQIAAAVGRSPAWVRDRVLLLQLGQDDQRRVSTSRLPLTQAVVAAKGKLAERTGRHRPEPIRPTHKPSAAAPVAPARARHCRTCRCNDEPANGN
jgi:ParB/RepB/Spo0J family partition protein